ncbi:alpha/beta fold hydrolase [Bacillus sp. Marseille-Q3570]|uniref:alpha/beta fold hydrolase n=1 Tax=Bacillus sp. Marseille-Q3570 TaxID=2963522 RepID=UPI0021B71CFD|nr:alpha/beta hydrolase [Bacillus sp. Marseille-Q3570]
MSTWKTQLIQTDRGTFEIFTKGDGIPVCITHLYSEFNETGDHFANIYSRRNQAILVNLRGTGRSTGYNNIDELSMFETVKDLEAVKEALGFEKWSFAGHSTGGMLGLLYALEFPDSIDRLIVVGSAASGDYALIKRSIYNSEHPKFNKMQDLISRLKSNCLHPDERKLLSRERTKLSLNEPEKYESYFSADVFKKMAANRLDYFGEYDFPNFDLRDKLKDIKVPTLIICGEHDVQCPIECSEEIDEGLNNSTFLRFQYSNHYPFLEEQERFQLAIRAFLA